MIFSKVTAMPTKNKRLWGEQTMCHFTKINLVFVMVLYCQYLERLTLLLFDLFEETNAISFQPIFDIIKIV